MIGKTDLKTGHKAKLTPYALMLINESTYKKLLDNELHYMATRSTVNGKVTDYLPNSKFTQSYK